MHVIASFDHSTYLELAITALEELGVPKPDILAVPLNKRAEKGKLFDTIHRSDGISLFDTGVAWATALTVVGSSYGFVLNGGPIIWGITGALTGFIVGFLIDLSKGKRQPNSSTIKGKSTEVFVLVDCQDHQAESVEAILLENFALATARYKAEPSEPSETGVRV